MNLKEEIKNIDLNYIEGDIVECVGIDISCQKDREDYASGKQKSPLVVGSKYQVTELKHKDYGDFVTVVSVDGGGVCVSGTYAHQFSKVGNFINKESKTFMSKALDYVKELTLSSDEKLLRKWGLKDDEGNYTHDSEKIVILKLVEDNKAHLLSIAQGLEDKEKASK